MGEPDDGKSTKSESDDNSLRCTICLDLVTDKGDRSTAKLQCGHEFHLDCIGSAFNIKGAMQCPNCREVEKGRWLYACSSACSAPEFHIEHLSPDEDPHQLSYYEMPIGVHWCPFSGLAQGQTSFWAVESPSPIYHNLQRYNALFAQRTPVSPVAPYVVYVRSIPPVSSNTNESVEDLNFNHHWNGIPVQNEIFSGHTFPVTDIQQQSWGHHSHPFSNSRHVNHTDQALVPLTTLRSTRDEYDAVTRSGAFVQPYFHGQGSFPRGASSFYLPVVHPGSNGQPHESVQASHPIHQQPQPGNSPGIPSAMVPDARIFSSPRGFPVAMPAISQSSHNGGLFIFPASAPSLQNQHEAENFLLSHIHAWERYQSHLAAISFGRYSVSGPFNHASGASDGSNRSGNLGQRHRS